MESNKVKHNILEKITFYTGLLILAMLVGYLLYETKTKENKPPNLEIITSYQRSMPYNTFMVETSNTGHETASSVNINFDLYQNGEVTENAILTINYVPRDSKEVGWINFRNAPSPSDSLVIKSVSFLKP